MPCWYFGKIELSRTPSVTDGIDTISEARYRREGVKFVIDVGAALGLRYDVCATAAVYFHRFYMFHSFTDFHRYVSATSCLFLAAKLEENTVTWNKLLDTIKVMLSEKQFTVFGKDPKEEVVATEKIILETLKFDLVVDLPYNHLLKFIKLVKGEPSTVEQLLKMSWTFINDCLCTTLCVQWEPELVALSLLYLSCHLIQFTVTDWIGKPADYDGKWYQYLINDINLDIIENICRQALGVYTSEKSRPTARERTPSPLSRVQNTNTSFGVSRKSLSVSVSPPPKPAFNDQWKTMDRNVMPAHDLQRSSGPVGSRERSPSLPRRRRRSGSSSSRSRNRSRGQRSQSPERRRLRSPFSPERRRMSPPLSPERRRLRSPISPDRRRVHSPSSPERRLARSLSPRMSYTERHVADDGDGLQRNLRSPSRSHSRNDYEFESRQRQCMAILQSGKMLTEAEFHMVKDLMQRDYVDTESYKKLDSLQTSLGIEFNPYTRRRRTSSTHDDGPHVPEPASSSYLPRPYVAVQPAHYHSTLPPHYYMEHRIRPPPGQAAQFHMGPPPNIPSGPQLFMHVPHLYVPAHPPMMMVPPHQVFDYQQLRQLPRPPQLPPPSQLAPPPQLLTPTSASRRSNLISIIPSQEFQLPPQTHMSGQPNTVHVVDVGQVCSSSQAIQQQAAASPDGVQPNQQSPVSKPGLQHVWRPL